MRTDHNIILVANYAPDVGYAWWLMENFWIQIAQECAASGHRCILLYPSQGPIPEQIHEAPLEVQFLDYEDRTPANLVRLGHLILQCDIAGVYLTDKPLFDPIYAYLRLLGVTRIVLHNHVPGERPPPSQVRWTLKRAIHRLRIFSCTTYIGVSQFVARRMILNGGVPRSSVVHIHNGIRLPKRLHRREPQLRREFGIEPEAIVVVSVGRAHRYKGIHFIIDLAARVHVKCETTITFLHVGDGPHLEEFQARTQALGLSHMIKFLGYRSDVPNILAESDIALHASHGEAFSLAILEYMAAELPVLAPDHCGNAEAISHRESGLLFQPGNLEEAVSKICRLIRSPETRCRLGKSARKMVEDNFTLDQCNHKFRSLINEALLH